MSSEPSATPSPDAGGGLIHPDRLTAHNLSVVMRGYDRDEVDRLLKDVDDAYLLLWRQSAALRERLRTIEDQLAVEESKALVSAKSISELIQRCATADAQLTEAQERCGELQKALDASTQEHKQAVAALREKSAKELDLGSSAVVAADDRPPEGIVEPPAKEGEAAALLLAASRAADDVRTLSRERALRTLLRARERASQLQAEAERQRADLTAMEDRRSLAEQEVEAAQNALAVVQEQQARAASEAEELAASARVERERAFTAIEDERQRIRELLTGTLVALDAESSAGDGGQPGDDEETLIADLSLRLPGSAERDPAEQGG